MMPTIRTKLLFATCTLSLTGCGLPYPGTIVELPSRQVSVTDVDGEPLSGFDLYVFRCTDPGSQVDRIFSFPNQESSTVVLEERTAIGWKRAGYAWLAPDFAIAFEPQPNWVACVAKPGYQSRRWSLHASQGETVTIKLRPAAEPGVDACTTERSGCTVCRSYEYFMYEEMRYRHGACSAALPSPLAAGRAAR